MAKVQSSSEYNPFAEDANLAFELDPSQTELQSEDKATLANGHRGPAPIDSTQQTTIDDDKMKTGKRSVQPLNIGPLDSSQHFNKGDQPNMNTVKRRAQPLNIGPLDSIQHITIDDDKMNTGKRRAQPLNIKLGSNASHVSGTPPSAGVAGSGGRASLSESTSHSIASPSWRSDISVQSPYTESECLGMFDDSFCSSGLTSVTSASDSVTSAVNVSDTQTDNDSVLTDEVFHAVIENSRQGARTPHNIVVNNGHSLVDTQKGITDEKEEQKSPPEVKVPRLSSPSSLSSHDRFKTFPVVETITLPPQSEDQEKEVLVTVERQNEQIAPHVPSTSQIQDKPNKSKDIVSTETDKGDMSRFQLKPPPRSFHITHPREYNQSHSNRRTLVMQDDVIHCQFLDNEYEALKEKRARLSICSRDMIPVPPRSKDYMQLSCLVMLCCNPVLGLVAFSFSVAVNSTYESGQYDRSMIFSKWARLMSGLGILVTCLLVVILLIFYWPDNYRQALQASEA